MSATLKRKSDASLILYCTMNSIARIFMSPVSIKASCGIIWPTLSIGPKSDFDTMELGHFRLQNRLDEWNLQVGAGPDGPHGNTEPFDDPFLIGSYDEGALPDQKDHQPSEEDISEATRRQE